MNAIHLLPDMMIPVKSEYFEKIFWMNLINVYLGEKIEVSSRATTESSVQ